MRGTPGCDASVKLPRDFPVGPRVPQREAAQSVDGDSCPGFPGCRVRRHRHEPALRVRRDLPWSPRHPCDDGSGARCPLARLLDPDGDRLPEVRPHRDARGQRGRGRHHVARIACHNRRAAGEVGDDYYGLRGSWRGPVLRRWRDHARDLCAFGRRRPRARGTRAAGLRRADSTCPARRTLLHPAFRHPSRRRDLRADHAGLVRCYRRPGTAERRPIARGLRLPIAHVCRELHDERPLDCVPGTRIRRPVRDGGRGALRRHGAVRAASHPPVLVCHRLTRALPQLSGSGCPGPARSICSRQPLLPARPRGTSTADGPAGDGCHAHRSAGRDLRGLFHDPAGHPPGLPATDDRRAHLGHGARPGVRAFRQLAPRRGRHRTGRGLPEFVQLGVGVRHRCHRHLRHHHVSDCGGRAPPVAPTLVDRRAWAGGVLVHRRVVLRCEPDQVRSRWLVPSRRRHGDLRGARQLARGFDASGSSARRSSPAPFGHHHRPQRAGSHAY